MNGGFLINQATKYALTSTYTHFRKGCGNNLPLAWNIKNFREGVRDIYQVEYMEPFVECNIKFVPRDDKMCVVDKASGVVLDSLSLNRFMHLFLDFRVEDVL